jgi:predicted ATPase/class 3 adenylate cyclase
VSELPTGTVSLLFSDIEGSTVLLSRLGPAYADALDGQRRVLRDAWAEHGGIELGTEGDSFFVAFPTAEGAVSAAAQAQRELAVFEWPAGEQVRVRMGIHTGTPQVHDGGYVGMDVHRAARIAGAAHGGQVVLSAATANLVSGHLPALVGLRDMGSHKLKDIAGVERLFQLTIEGLCNDFAPLKTLGAATSLPKPATPLVGRAGELAELASLVRSGVRLVSLTGPGGSGKTRLAIGLAQGLASHFPDGVYFVPLEAARTEDVMWTSLAAVLDVPLDARTVQGLLEHVAHRSALFVLDNLEQIDGADNVVARLLEAAPDVVVIATTRRPLHLAGEQEHPVPPLQVSGAATLVEAEASGAVQLFVQHARKVRPSFRLTSTNAPDVIEVCRALDGLPLAIELAAARSKLLSPAAVLARLDKALDIAASGRQGPVRQKTLRDTIGWSYQLLTAQQQAFFRRLGVFADGADLEAVGAVTTEMLEGGDPLDVVAELVDASLANISESVDSEPRVNMLATIRAYALERLQATDELDNAGRCHAAHYLALARRLKLMAASQYVEARTLVELDLDNFRRAMSWALGEEPGAGEVAPRLSLALELSATLGWLWASSGYVAEGRRWCEAAIERSQGLESPALAYCLSEVGYLLALQGHTDGALKTTVDAVQIARITGSDETLIEALSHLGSAQMSIGDLDAARPTFDEVLTLLGPAGPPARRLAGLANLAILEHMQHHFDRSEELWNQALAIGKDLGNVHYVADIEVNIASLLDRTGRVTEAHEKIRNLVADVLPLDDPGLTTDLADVYVDILIRLGKPERAAELFGAALATRERDQIPHVAYQESEIAETIVAGRKLIAADGWEYHCKRGRMESLDDLLTSLSQHPNDGPTAPILAKPAEAQRKRTL